MYWICIHFIPFHYISAYFLYRLYCIFVDSMAANNNRTQYSLRGILEKEKLTGSNFSGWHRNLRIVLRQERKLHILDDPVPEQPADEAPLAQISAYKKYCDEAEDVACLMLATMSPELQETLQDKTASEMIEHLKTRFGGNKRQERVETSRKLFGCAGRTTC